MRTMMKSIRNVKVVFSHYYAEFYKPRGRGWSSRPFYTCGNPGVGEEFAVALQLLGHRVVREYTEEGDNL
jgi:hypothetical protein